MTRISLARGAARAVVSLVGGRVLSYVVDGVEVLAGDEPEDVPWYRSSLLTPWPNRVADGRWRWRDCDLELPVNEPAVNAALHGLVAYAGFDVDHLDEQSVRVRHTLHPSPGYPFHLEVVAGYALDDDGLYCALEVHNIGAEDAPVGLGVHPYLATRGPVDDATLQLPASTLVLTDEQWQELGRTPVEDTSMDFRTPRGVGGAAIDACWTDVIRGSDGCVSSTLAFPDGDTVSLWGGPTTEWLVVYNGDTLPGDAHRHSIAIEPCTAPANALRTGTGLTVLAPNTTSELTWGISTSW